MVKGCTIYTYSILTPWCRVPLEQLTGLQLVKKFPAFHGTRRFIAALTSVRHLSLSWASPIQSIYPHPTSWRSILILSTHLRLGLPSGLFPYGFPHQDPIHPPILTHTRHMPSPSHSSRFYHPHSIVWGVQIIELLFMHSPHFTVTSSLLGPNILLNTMFSNTLEKVLGSCDRASWNVGRKEIKQQDATNPIFIIKLLS